MNFNNHGPTRRVGAVIVTYHPDTPTIQTLVAKLVCQVESIVIVDNGTDVHLLEALGKALPEEQVLLLPLGENKGVAAAHNIGIANLLERGYDYVLLLDQDSMPASNMVTILMSKTIELSHQGVRVAAIGPTFIDSRTQEKARVIRRHGADERHHTGDAIEASFIISSGSLLSKQALLDIGNMNEGYFIDHVDTEWCLRARARGWLLFNVSTAHMFHSLGDNVIQIWLGRQRQVAVHSPLRNYYVLRNAVLMLRDTPMTWAERRFHLIRIGQFLFFFGLVIGPRRSRLKMMLTGICHGLLGRTGKYIETTK